MVTDLVVMQGRDGQVFVINTSLLQPARHIVSLIFPLNTTLNDNSTPLFLSFAGSIHKLVVLGDRHYSFVLPHFEESSLLFFTFLLFFSSFNTQPNFEI